MTIDPAWAGQVQFYELVFGIWTAYIFLVAMWELGLRERLDEWRYVMLNFLGAGAFWINHYFQLAPFWALLLNTYTVVFLVSWWWIAVRGRPRSMGWKAAALAGALVYTAVFIGFEQLARKGVDAGIDEFWFMFASFFGFAAVILWRGRRAA